MKRYFGKMAAAVLPLVFGMVHADAAPQDFHSGVEQVTLLELYTSEGCSSCPPAEAWLNRNIDSAELWKNVVPVAFHVDYWDSLGWHDRWASKVFTDRQRSYARAWSADDIYTPAVVRNGREWQDWGTSATPAGPSPAKPGDLRATSADGREWKIVFTPAEGTIGDFDVHVALLGSAMRSDIKAGENVGKQLVHDFVALSLQDAAMERHDGRRDATITLSGDQAKDSAKLAVAIWVTHRGELIPVQAAGGWLTQ